MSDPIQYFTPEELAELAEYDRHIDRDLNRRKHEWRKAKKKAAEAAATERSETNERKTEL